MNPLRQAAQQALEALEILDGVMRRSQRTDAAITALKQALAEPEQEPVAWRLYKDGELYSLKFAKEDRGPHYTWEPLYTAPTPRKPLSDEEIKAALVSTDPETKRLPPGFRDFARAIERAHGIGEQT